VVTLYFVSLSIFKKKNMKKLKISIIALAVGLMSFATATNFTLEQDSVHSSFIFTVKHMGIADFNGMFKKYDTKITGTKADLSDAVIEFTAESASIDTRVEKRDNHVKSADFLDVTKYPEITFVSTSVKKGKGENYTIVGDFTLHGVTKSITLNAEKTGEMVNPDSKEKKIGMKFTGELKRKDFGVGESFPDAVVSNEIRFMADMEFTVTE
jgi:polyisoprenoid-binding protein YceI